MQNTFHGTVQEFANDSIHMLCGETMTLRQQITVREHNELKRLDGWSDPFNLYLQHELDKLAETVSRITYNPTGTPQQAGQEAKQTGRSLKEDFNASSIRADDVVMPAKPPRPLVYELDGSDPNIPQLNTENCPNNQLRNFVAGLDDFFVNCTRLDSRHDPTMITADESAKCRRMLEKLWALCEIKGGDKNRTIIHSGVLASDEPSTFQGGGGNGS